MPQQLPICGDAGTGWRFEEKLEASWQCIGSSGTECEWIVQDTHPHPPCLAWHSKQFQVMLMMMMMMMSKFFLVCLQKMMMSQEQCPKKVWFIAQHHHTLLQESLPCCKNWHSSLLLQHNNPWQDQTCSFTKNFPATRIEFCSAATTHAIHGNIAPVLLPPLWTTSLHNLSM